MKKTKQKIMVLGSEGQIGKPLTKFLKEKGHEVFEFDIRKHKTQDLSDRYYTLNNITLIDQIKSCDFVYFLAYDVGGSVYLEINQDNFEYVHNNTKIMAHTFEILKDTKVPFLFATSSMSDMSWSSYGTLKKLGEHYTRSLKGINAKLWNVYGPDDQNPETSIKSHVITDFIHKAKTTGKIEMRTNGREFRQFLYVDDCVRALYELMNCSRYNFVLAKTFTFDISSYEWVSIYKIARLIGDQLNVPVIQNEYRDDAVQNNSKIEPHHSLLNEYWKPKLSLEEGIERMIEAYDKKRGHYE